jgi:uncharacterized repeat protein (TIGR02543 family)
VSGSSTKTYYAIWRKTIKITYDANGGTNPPSSSTGYMYNADTSVSIILSSTIPTRLGYKFIGWGTSPNSTTVAYKPNSSYSFNTNITLYAIWEPNGIICIYVNNEWKMALPYVYDSTGWKLTLPYTYATSEWKINGA